MAGELISFRCACGAAFQAKPEMAGKRGKCNKCGAVMTIPPAGAAPAKAAAAKVQPPAAGKPPPPKKQTSCSICQTAIGPGEATHQCSACGLPFHQECWQANFGCATYGCKNVNVLKPGPDIAIGHAHMASPAAPAPWQTPGAGRGGASSDVPWEYILLAASAVAGLISCVGFGVPSLLVALAAVLYAANVPQPAMPVLAGVWGISAITFLLGVLSSSILWMM